MEGNIENYIKDIREAVVNLDKKILIDIVSEGLSQGIKPLMIINDGLTVGLRKVGDLFDKEEYFLPELILGGQIVTEAIEVLKPHLAKGEELQKKELVMIATVQGDVHEIGKNLVGLLLRAAGYEVMDLGKNVPTEAIVDKVIQFKPKILGLSSLLSTTMPIQKKVIQALEEAGVRDAVKIMVGGAPVTREWAERIGADGYGEGAAEAVEEADRLIGA
jgi:corrinoid protein of di/trimethylamine methyltransferase